jgi:hypothetical protein
LCHFPAAAEPPPCVPLPFFQPSLVCAVAALGLLGLGVQPCVAWELAPHGTVPPVPDTPAGPRTEVHVTTVNELMSATWNAQSDQTILVAPGTYRLADATFANGVDGRLTIGRYGRAPIERVELRGETDNPEDVVILGAGMLDSTVPSCIHIFSAVDLLISGVTIRQCYYHLIQVDANQGASNIKMHSLILTEAGQQLIKFSGSGAHESSVAWSHLSSGPNGAPDHPEGAGGVGCYTNAIDINGAHDDFMIQHITIEDYKCEDGSLPGPAILMWNGVRDTVIDSITMIDITRGIALGLIDRAGDHTGGRVTNSFITQKFGQPTTDVAIYINSPNAVVAHNTILTNGAYFGVAIESRFSSTTNVLIQANLMDGSVNRRNGSQATEQDRTR